MSAAPGEGVVHVLAPAGTASGGQEALHQLAHYLGKKGIDARMAYYHEGTRLQNPVNVKYLQYACPWSWYDEVPDDERHCVVCPEIATHLLSRFVHARKAIWWLSVGFYRAAAREQSWGRIISLVLRGRFGEARDRLTMRSGQFPRSSAEAVHFAGSHYARDFVRRKFKVEATLLIEPLGLDFLRLVVPNDPAVVDKRGRERVVLYNPAKKSRVMSRLMKEHPEHDYVALQGFSAGQLVNRLRSGMLYVDFGKFPGPERLPKEAVACGCCVLTGRRGAAAFHDDVRVPDEYRLKTGNSEEINRKVVDLLDNYSDRVDRFKEYRAMVAGLEENFLRQIEEMFAELQKDSL